jgi:hypothetical protein
MNISGRSLWQLQLFSMIVLIVPMIVYPTMLGTELQKFAFTHILYELLFYFVVTFVLYRQVTVFQAIQITGFCLIYRLVLGVVFSFLLAAIHSISINVSFTLGMFSYLPGMLLHIVATPLLLKPVLDGIYAESFKVRTLRVVESSASERTERGGSTTAYSKDRKSNLKQIPRPLQKLTPNRKSADYSTAKETQFTSGELNGFEKATKYVGEDGSVRLACVIDNEGLLLSNFTRGELIAEDIAPYALTIAAACAEKIDRITTGAPERMEFTLRDFRIVLAVENNCSFMVIAERRSDDLMNIRFNQALEMIKKYMSERYSPNLHPSMEKTYA